MIQTLCRRPIAWLALCSIVFAATAPAVTRWIASSSTELGWIDVCSTAGFKRIAFDAGSKNAPVGDHAAKQCPFCRTCDQQPVVPTGHAFHLFFPDARSELPLDSAHIPLRLSPVGPAGPARAPPAFS